MIVSMLRDKYGLKEAEVSLLSECLFQNQSLMDSVSAINERLETRNSSKLMTPKEVYSFCSQLCKELFEDSIRNIAPAFSSEWDSLDPDRREIASVAKSRLAIIGKFKRMLDDFVQLEKEILSK